MCVPRLELERSHSLEATVVEAVASDVFQARRKMGNFWSLAVYKQFKGGVPPKKDITTQVIFGKKERGVILDDSHGCPVGVVELFAVSESGTRMTGCLGTSDNMDQEDIGVLYVDRLRKQF